MLYYAGLYGTNIGAIRGPNVFIYPKIPNKGRTSNNMCAPLFWRKKRNGKLKGAHQIKSARTLFEMRPLIGTLGCAL